MSVNLLRADARSLPLADSSVDLVVTSPPYFGLRSYQDGGKHYTGQVGDEATPAEFVDALIECTREMVRVLKPSGSIWVNLGDRFSPGMHLDREGMTMEDAAWLAGVIDSDGSISVHVNKQPEGRAPSFVPWMRVGQMRPEVVEQIAAVTGVGKVNKDGRGVWNWGASAQQAAGVLRLIWPWLHIKQRQALAAVELARHIGEARNKGTWNKVSSDAIAYRQSIREAVLDWNAGRPNDYQPPRLAKPNLPSSRTFVENKSLMGIPWRYAIRCIDDLGLILRAEVIWSKPNGLPESVTDRVRRSHETWFHFTKEPRYYSSVDAIREAHQFPNQKRTMGDSANGGMHSGERHKRQDGGANPLGKLPGSVWTVPTEPLRVPDDLGVDHFAAFPTEFPRRIIQGWSPEKVCSACGFLLGSTYDNGMHGVRKELRSVAAQGSAKAVLRQGVCEPPHREESKEHEVSAPDDSRLHRGLEAGSPNGAEVRVSHGAPVGHVRASGQDARSIRGGSPQERDQDGQPDRKSGTAREGRTRPLAEAGSETLPMPALQRSDPDLRNTLSCPNCGCDQLRPAVIADPFGGTGTTALCADVLGRHGISVDMSADYLRIAQWRTTDPKQRAKAARTEHKPPVEVPDGQATFDLDGITA